MDTDNSKIPGDHKSRGPAKSSYVKPAFRHEQIFETMALACGKVSSTQLQCKSSLKTS